MKAASLAVEPPSMVPPGAVGWGRLGSVGGRLGVVRVGFGGPMIGEQSEVRGMLQAEQEGSAVQRRGGWREE